MRCRAFIALADGEAVSAQGAFKAELYDKDGVKRLSLSMVADNVLALRQPLCVWMFDERKKFIHTSLGK